MIMTTHDPNHALWFGGKAALMKDGRLLAVGPASEVITEAALTDTYDVEVAVFSSPSHPGRQPRLVSSPWHTDADV